jgi:hypothetical protein
VSGYVTDSTTGEALIGAGVYIQELGKGVPTNGYGYYSATLEQGRYTLLVRYIGYADLARTVMLDQDSKVDLRLPPTAQLMKPVEVEAKRGEGNTESTDMGRMDVDVTKLQTLPALLGEVDILKTIQYLPGVKSNGEGNSGFYVRGGGPDQNLILLDEATVYNASHLFGFFSVFNADAVKNIELIKGGMPAYYGGRDQQRAGHHHEGRQRQGIPRAGRHRPHQQPPHAGGADREGEKLLHRQRPPHLHRRAGQALHQSGEHLRRAAATTSTTSTPRPTTASATRTASTSAATSARRVHPERQPAGQPQLPHPLGQRHGERPLEPRLRAQALPQHHRHLQRLPVQLHGRTGPVRFQAQQRHPDMA